MPEDYLVRVGLLGVVGRFTSADSVSYRRGTRVVCRTTRGLEVGQVLASLEPFQSSAENASASASATDGDLLRALAVEDELLCARLEQNKLEAIDACQLLLEKHNSPAVLLDAEQLFDGSAIYFYFLGDLPQQLEIPIAELASTYEANVHLERFAETLEAGCGPDCGTEAAEGQVCGSCAGCAVIEACKSN